MFPPKAMVFTTSQKKSLPRISADSGSREDIRAAFGDYSKLVNVRRLNSGLGLLAKRGSRQERAASGTSNREGPIEYDRRFAGREESQVDLISLRFHFDVDFTATPLRLHCSLRFHFDPTSTSCRCHLVDTSMPVRFRLDI